MNRSPFASIAAFAWGVIALALSCSTPVDPPDFNNPIDPGYPDFVELSVEITSGPDEGATLLNHTVSFTWASDTLMQEYRYQLTGRELSPWTDATSATFTFLDEGDYRFDLTGRRDSGDQASDTARFVIDAVAGPALRFFPRQISVGSSGQFEIEVYAEEVDSLKGFKLVIDYNPTILNWVDAQLDTAGLLGRSGGQIIRFRDIDSFNGTITFDAVLVGGASRSVSGTGPLARLIFRVISNQASRRDTELSFNALTLLRNEENRTIALTATVPAQVDF